jgi:hypothetical protein
MKYQPLVGRPPRSHDAWFPRTPETRSVKIAPKHPRKTQTSTTLSPAKAIVTRSFCLNALDFRLATFRLSLSSCSSTSSSSSELEELVLARVRRLPCGGASSRSVGVISSTASSRAFATSSSVSLCLFRSLFFDLATLSLSLLTITSLFLTAPNEVLSLRASQGLSSLPSCRDC